MYRQRLWRFLVLASLLIWRDPLPLPFSAVPPSASVRAVQSVPSPALGRRQYGAPVGSPIDGGLSDQSQIDVPLDPEVPSETDRYRPITILNIAEVAEKHHRLAPCLDDIRLSSLVFPFKASPYVVEELIDWEREGSITDDPFYRLIFPTMAMLSSEHQARLREVQEEALELKAVVAQIRRELNPHPAGQKELNAPKEDGLTGIQHKYDSTVLFFQQLHKLAMPIAHTASAGHNLLGFGPEVCTERCWRSFLLFEKAFGSHWRSLFTGGDPMIMKTRFLRKYLEPFKNPKFLPQVKNLRIGTRSLSFWPQRFLSDDDADEVISLLSEIRQVGGRHIAIMAHLGHWRELQTAKVQRAIKRLQSEAGVIIRSQAPLMRGINDDAEVWAEKWRSEVNLGIVPYYMFLARDTGAQSFFSVPLDEAHTIFSHALRSTSGLCRTVRGPVMSATPGKVEVTGVEEIMGQAAIVLRFVQCRHESWIGRVFFAKYKPNAIWFDDLEPLDGMYLPWDKKGLIMPSFWLPWAGLATSWPFSCIRRNEETSSASIGQTFPLAWAGGNSALSEKGTGKNCCLAGAVASCSYAGLL